jgi:menaquinone-dependent protoporphyrinogen oxidase
MSDTQDAQSSRVLVAYASKYGSTKGVADLIVAALRDDGIGAELLRTDSADSVASYDAVVLGSPLFNQRWLPEADEFVRRNLNALAQRPVWLFSVGSFGDSKRIIGRLMRREPRNIRALQDAVQPRDYRVFAGVIDRRRWPAYSRLLYHAFGGRLGDNRDWRDIERWARSIATVLQAPAPHSMPPPTDLITRREGAPRPPGRL